MSGFMKSARISTSGKKDRGVSDNSQAMDELFQHRRATALTFASVANGVALGLFVYQTIEFNKGAEYFYILNVCTFVLMVRFWWRYAIFSYYAPSRFIDQYFVDFAIAAIGIAAVFFFSQPDRWALCYAAVYLLAVWKACQLTATLDPVACRRREDYGLDLNRKIPYLVRSFAFSVISLVWFFTGNNKIWVWLCIGVLVMIFLSTSRRRAVKAPVVPKRGISPGPTAPLQVGSHAEQRRAKKRSRIKRK
jgi:hypothetical protein